MRLPRSRGRHRRGRLTNMISIQDRPVEAVGRQVAGHSEGGQLKRARNASTVGTLVERKSPLLMLAKVDGMDAQAVLEGFPRRLRVLPVGLLKTLAGLAFHAITVMFALRNSWWSVLCVRPCRPPGDRNWIA